MSTTELKANAALEHLEDLLNALDSSQGRQIARAIDRMIAARIAQALEAQAGKAI